MLLVQVLFSHYHPLFVIKQQQILKLKITNPESGQEEAAQWIKDGGFILIIIGLLQMFWALAHVCDHYFVTSLRILCEEWHRLL